MYIMPEALSTKYFAHNCSDSIALQGKQAVYTGSKEQSLQVIVATTPPNAVVLIMGARDPYLDAFAQQVLII